MTEMTDQRSGPDAGTPVARRVMLATLGIGVAGIAAAPFLQRGWDSALGAASQYDPTKLTGLLPNSSGFRYYSVADSVPHKDATNYQLTVDGLVDRPRTYTLDELHALPQTRVVHDVQCTDGWGVPNTPFEGPQLSTILDAAGVRPEGKAIRFNCFDGVYSESLTLEQARRPDVLVALKMQDKPVTYEHGGPVRLYVAPMYFYKSAKWLSGITVTDQVIPGYWEVNGYDVDGWLPGADRRSSGSSV
jgi:DMSO/TMAO reductase YedYZ molybdopterin-dependent catalytic subunit